MVFDPKSRLLNYWNQAVGVQGEERLRTGRGKAAVILLQVIEANLGARPKNLLHID